MIVSIQDSLFLSSKTALFLEAALPALKKKKKIHRLVFLTPVWLMRVEEVKKKKLRKKTPFSSGNEEIMSGDPTVIF